jgi:hypothetical protein
LTYKLPRPIHSNRILEGIVNGWELSNYTTYQDGANFQANNPTMNVSYCTTDGTGDGANCKGAIQPNITMYNGVQTTAIGANTWYGTNEYPNQLIPLIVCDPTKGLMKGQKFNPNCFAAPLPPSQGSYGTQGPWQWPYFRNPSYFGSDMAVFKAFRINDSQRVEARISATNWLNHPNAGFNINSNADNSLNFHGYSTAEKYSYNQNFSTTGIPQAKYGYRWLQFAAKYYF